MLKVERRFFFFEFALKGKPIFRGLCLVNHPFMFGLAIFFHHTKPLSYPVNIHPFNIHPSEIKAWLRAYSPLVSLTVIRPAITPLFLGGAPVAIPVAYHHLLGSIKPPEPLSPETKKVNAITVTESASKQLIRTCLAPKEEQRIYVYIYIYYILYI